MVSTTELNILYCMVNDIKLDICHAIIEKLRVVAIKVTGAIKVGGLVTTIATYLSFNTENMPFKKVKGHFLIDNIMMEAMGLVHVDHRGRAFLNQPDATCP